MKIQENEQRSASGVFSTVLNDEIEKQEKQSGPSFGIGVGGIGRGVGGGVGVGTGGTGYTAEDLRKRRVDVRMEMKRRNITP
jgi:hypothetical protein